MIVPLTREIYMQFEGSPPAVTMIGVAMVNDGVEAIVAAANFLGQPFIVCGVKPGASKREILKGWRIFKEKHIIKNKIYYAIIDKDLSTAPSFLNHFGFTRLDEDTYFLRG